uniref:DUF1738 domain-containing protein n=1 Tax=Prevotella sp. GTC17254 TaxID=3236794 RepID=A0AB33IZP3_9BACT
MRENDNLLGIFGNRLLNGWGKLFGKRRDGKETEGSVRYIENLKPFPANHFFSPEELRFLSNNQEQCTRLQGWALQMSLWAKSKSDERDRNNPQFFPAVQWQDGLMSTWIDSKVSPDSIDQQADRLCQLQLDGYEMSSDFIRMIEAKACRSLVGNLFMRKKHERQTDLSDTKSFILVYSVVDKVGEVLALSVFYYDKVSHHHISEEKVPYKQFKSLIDKKEITAFSNDAQREWNEEATVRDTAEKQFAELLFLMKKSNVRQGMFPANNSFIIRFKDGEDNVPVAWSLSEDKIKVDFAPKFSVDRNFHFITSDNSYLHAAILDFIHKTVSEQDGSRDLLTFVRVFGRDFCGDKVLSSGNQPLCQINGIDIDRVTAKVSNSIVAFNNETLETVPLSLEDRLLLLKAVIRYSDTLLTELKSSLLRSPDETAKQLLQDKLDNICHGLSVYNTKNDSYSLDELWQHILSAFGVSTRTADQPAGYGHTPGKDACVPPTTVSSEETLSPIQEETEKNQKFIDSNDDDRTVEQTVNEQMEGRTMVSLPQNYIPLEPASKGRWHTPAMMLREAHRAFGKLLSTKLKKQLNDENAPWVSKSMMIPRDCNGTIYTGANAIMLALWTEEQGFDLPFFISEDEIRAKELGILQDAESLFVLNKDGATRVYNIAQTSFPITQRRSYESLKLNMIAAERKKTSGYQFLDSDVFCNIPLQFDGTPNLSVYNHADKVIHIAPKDSFSIEDDYYRDLAVAMIESTREVNFDTLRLDTYLFENLVSHLGSGIISQSCRFNATNPEYSRIWRERLENNPEYTKRILEQSDASSVQVLNMALT